MRRRAGVTLIEVVAVLGLLLFLAALLAPFLFRLRVEAADAQGNNNLRNLVLAVHNYNDSLKRIPPTVGKGPLGRSGSILYHLLPFMEQNPIYQRGPVWEAGTISVPVTIYLDPRDKTAPGNKFEDWLATSSFAANWLAFKNGDRGIGNGFPDGTSNTIVFSTRYQVCNRTPCGWGYDQLYYWAPMFGYYSTAKFQTSPTAADCDPALPQSFDKDRILVAMADGVTRYVRDSISPRTWYRALDPDDGNPNGQDFED